MKSIIRFIILGIGLAIGCSCKDTTSPVVKLFREHIGKEINLKGFEEVYSEQDTLSYSDFLKDILSFLSAILMRSAVHVSSKSVNGTSILNLCLCMTNWLMCLYSGVKIIGNSLNIGWASIRKLHFSI